MEVVNENDEDKHKICRFYEQGNCRSGSQCRFDHDNANELNRIEYIWLTIKDQYKSICQCFDPYHYN